MKNLLSGSKAIAAACCAMSLISVGLLAQNAAVPFENQSDASATLDLGKVFAGSPIIYTILLVLSVFSFVVWLYSLFTLRQKEFIPVSFIEEITPQLRQQRYAAALKSCQDDNSPLAKIVSAALQARRYGHQAIAESVQQEGRRLGIALWQRVSLLNDVITIAPMLGLLGTVVGMFYAFYDVNRSMESIMAIFDGLGIAIGTTVAGLIVAIMSMIFHSMLKLRITRLLNTVESEAMSLTSLIDVEKSATTAANPEHAMATV